MVDFDQLWCLSHRQHTECSGGQSFCVVCYSELSSLLHDCSRSSFFLTYFCYIFSDGSSTLFFLIAFLISSGEALLSLGNAVEVMVRFIRESPQKQLQFLSSRMPVKGWSQNQYNLPHHLFFQPVLTENIKKCFQGTGLYLSLKSACLTCMNLWI